MHARIKKILTQVAVRTQGLLGGKKADHILGWASLAESSFLPIIIDPILVALILADRARWWRFVVIATITSVIGGFVAYLLGFLFFDAIGAPLIALYGLEQTFTDTRSLVARGAFIFTFIGAFTPVPYKLVAILAGVLTLNPFVFLLASIVGRFGRMLAVGYITYRIGAYVSAMHIFRSWKGGLTAGFVFGALVAYALVTLR